MVYLHWQLQELSLLQHSNAYTAKKDLLPQMHVVCFSVEITAFYVIMTVFLTKSMSCMHLR
jgi:hypothetical protein